MLLAHLHFFKAEYGLALEHANRIIKWLNKNVSVPKDKELLLHARNIQAQVAIEQKNPTLAVKYCKMVQEAYMKLDKMAQIFNQTIYFKSCLFLYMHEKNNISAQRINFQYFFANTDRKISMGQSGMYAYLLLSDKVVTYESRVQAYMQLRQYEQSHELIRRLVFRFLRQPKLYPDIFRLVISLRMMSADFATTYNPICYEQVVIWQSLSDTIMDMTEKAINTSPPDDSALQQIIGCLKTRPSQMDAETIQKMLT